jgi:hypothetical protein
MAEPSFLSWCQNHGIKVKGVKPDFVTDGWRGIVATCAIEPDTTVMTVPGELLISVMSAEREPELAQVLKRHHLSSLQVQPGVFREQD